MKRFVTLVVGCCLLGLVSGCGSEKAPSKTDQKKVLEQTQADMAKGMEAMKAIKGPAK